MVSPCYCVVCAVRLQFKILWQGYIKKIYGFTDGYTDGCIPTDYNPSVFHRELQNKYGIVPLSPTDLPTNKNPLVFHRELQKNYGIVPPSSMGTATALSTSDTDEISTDVRTSQSARMSDTCPSAHIPTALPMTNTDGITNGFTHISKRTHVWHVSVCTNTDGVSDGSKSLAGFLNFFGVHFN